MSCVLIQLAFRISGHKAADLFLRVGRSFIVSLFFATHSAIPLLHKAEMSSHYTPNGYIVPAKFGVHFLPLSKKVPKRTQLHLNEIGLNNTEFCKIKVN